MTTRRNRRLMEDFERWEQELADFSDEIGELVALMGRP